MNSFLTEKARSTPFWHKPVFFLMAFLEGITLWVIVDFVLHKDYETAAAGVFLGALFAWPMVRIFRRGRSARQAQMLTQAFMGVSEDSLPMDQLYSRVPIPRLDQRLRRLISDGYLKNVYVDAQKSAVCFTSADQHVQREERVLMECPHCGAKNSVIRGRVNRCAYCDSPLIYTPSK